jgi:hypothetical protein
MSSEVETSRGENNEYRNRILPTPLRFAQNDNDDEGD